MDVPRGSGSENDPTRPVADCDAAETLAALCTERAEIFALEARRLARAAHWADLHPAESISDATAFDNTEVGGSWSEHEEPIAGPGCPLVAEFCLADLGAVLGITTTAAKRLIGHALELRHRLPRLWQLVQAGKVEAWRAERIAETTIHTWPALTQDAMAYIDFHVAPKAGKIGQRALDNLVEEAITRFHLLEAEANDDSGTQGPEAPFHLDFFEGSSNGQVGMHVEGFIDVADALELQSALSAGAAALAEAGSSESLAVRKARTLGTLARGQNSRELVLNLHLSATTTGGLGIDPVTRLDEGQRVVVIDQLATWCEAAGASVKVLPVIDLNLDLTSPGRVPGRKLRRQVQLRDRTCVFPYCNRRAVFTDLDHTDAYDPGKPGTQTRSRNLGCLCRMHHRLKTFGRWKLRQVQAGEGPPGTFIWTSPHGYVYVRHPDGTTEWVPPRDDSAAA